MLQSIRLPDSYSWEEESLKVLVNIEIRRSGALKACSIAGTSGNRRYDREVLRSLRDNLELPAFPDKIRDEYISVNIPVLLKTVP